MIRVNYLGRLGNNMFQYCLGRIFAEEWGCELHAEPLPDFPNTAHPVLGNNYQAPVETIVGHTIDFTGILRNSSQRKLVLDGFFQRYEYYRPYRAQIQNWLSFSPDTQVPTPDPHSVVLNVRRTDYISYGWALPFSFYRDALACISPSPKKIWIVTDDSSDPFFKSFEPWQPNFFHGSPAEQMLFMTRARHFVMSQSTFSWWPTFLGNHQQVICPDSTFGAWSSHGGAASESNLIERDRFLCVPCKEQYKPTNEENRHQVKRARTRRVIMALNRHLRLSLPEPPP
jgi:hypothetical protein